MYKQLLLTTLIVVSFIHCGNDDTANQPNNPFVIEEVDLQLDTLASGLQNPWALDFLPDGSILICERPGNLIRFENGNLTTITGLPQIEAVGQGGLMDILLHPDYANNQSLFFTATTPATGGYSTGLYKANFNETTNALENVEMIYQATPINWSQGHFGSRIVIDEEGYIFLALGERQIPEMAQDNTNSSGTVVRLHQDGTIPSDNPFVNDPTIASEIWSYGHRNPQGMDIHPETGKIWLHEHGPQGGDEINIVEKGGNYGWPIATYGINYDGTIISEDTFVVGTILPIYYWIPSIAPCGMGFYNSDSIPQWKGSLFLGALAGWHLNRLDLDDESVVAEYRLLQDFGRFRAVKQGPDGYLYFLTEGNGGLFCRYRPVP